MNPDNLNLLPQDLQVSKGLSSLLKTARSLGVILIVTFIIFCLGMGAYFIYSKITLDNIQTNVDQLKTQVKAQEGSEQQLVLLRDRLQKIASVKGIPSAGANISGINSLLANMSTNLKMSEANIDPLKMSLSLRLYSNEDLSTFLQNLKSTALFNQIELATFSYGATGYNLDVNLSNADGK